MSKYTPGPWEHFPAGNYQGFAVAPSRTLPALASVERCGQQCNVMVHNFPGSTEANARLIAAAPELLEALTNLVAVVQMQQRVEALRGKDDPKAWNPALDVARAALSAAGVTQGAK